MWAEIKKAINSNLNVPLNEGGVKIVKSVQRGIVDSSALPCPYTINVNEINPEKAIVIFDSGHAKGDGTYADPCLLSVGSTSFQVGGKATTAGMTHAMSFSWQLIEFY